jgi:hypothetical protein
MDKKENKCRVCGCTDSHACPGGCWWVQDDLCSSCADAFAKTADHLLNQIGSSFQISMIENETCEDNERVLADELPDIHTAIGFVYGYLEGKKIEYEELKFLPEQSKDFILFTIEDQKETGFHTNLIFSVISKDN